MNDRLTGTTATRVRYKVDLQAMMADCEANYRRLQQLLDGTDGGDACILLEGCDYGVVLRLRERTPYTSLVEMSAEGGVGVPAWLASPTLLVRLYHDARMAEVVSFDSARKAQPRYSYPNERMFHSDEKAQWNIFLADWLRHCLHQGLANQSVLI